MVIRMKTTIELPDALFAAAKQQALRDGTTLRSLIETGLRQVLDERERASTFTMRDGSYGRGGIAPELADVDWSVIRDLAYTDRGT